MLGSCSERFPLLIHASRVNLARGRSHLHPTSPSERRSSMSAKPQITRCFIYDVAAGKDVAALSASFLWNKSRSIRVDVTDADEVTFNLDNGKLLHVEHAAPWMLNGDAVAVALAAGRHSLSITAKNKRGATT